MTTETQIIVKGVRERAGGMPIDERDESMKDLIFVTGIWIRTRTVLSFFH